MRRQGCRVLQVHRATGHLDHDGSRDFRGLLASAPVSRRPQAARLPRAPPPSRHPPPCPSRPASPERGPVRVRRALSARHHCARPHWPWGVVTFAMIRHLSPPSPQQKKKKERREGIFYGFLLIAVNIVLYLTKTVTVSYDHHTSHLVSQSTSYSAATYNLCTATG